MSNEKPKCFLIDGEANVFAIIGAVSRVLKKAGMHDEAKEFCEKASNCESYNAVLNLCHECVDVE